MRRATDPIFGGLHPIAAAFEFGLVWMTLGALFLLGLPTSVSADEWLAFGILVPVVAVVHLVGADRQKHQGSQLSLAPLLAAVLLLPPALAAAVAAFAFLPEWLRTRTPWYIVMFNAANFVGPALGAGVAFRALAGEGAADWALGALAAIAVFVALQYAALAVVLRFARGVPPRETIRLDCVVIDAGLLSLGAIAAALAGTSPWLVLLTILPLALAYRSLAVPALVEATRVEPQTGLFNLRHFHSCLRQELGRAARFDRPLAVLMIDVDHLREINNVHGHLAGDRALKVVAASLREGTRDYDIAARFGGDEFCVLLPETELAGALVVAERIRAGVESSAAELGFPLTISIGATEHAGDGGAAETLVARADRAAYRAKASGRNAVAAAADGDPVREAEALLRDAAG
jgi:diguanylate cyclase (GGDEF)-like protein